jgi:hypothetical protein
VPMRTTVTLESALLKQAEREALRRGTTLTALIEQGLRLVLSLPAQGAPWPGVQLPVSTAGSGALPGVDLNDSATLLEVMEGCPLTRGK